MKNVVACVFGVIIAAFVLVMITMTAPVFVVGLVAFLVALLSFNSMIKKLCVNILLGIDQLYNTMMLGDPDETISSRAGRRWPNSWWSRLIDTLFFWQKNHTKNAIETDETYKRDLLKKRTKGARK